MKKYITHISGISKLADKAYSLLTEFSYVSYVELKSETELKTALSNCDIFWFRLNHSLSRTVLENVRCKFIVCAVTGLDHIDLEACDEYGINVVSLKGETEFLNNVRATAEHTMGLMLTLLRKTKRAFSHVEEGNWNRYLFQGNELYSKKLGIYGFGRLGKMVADYASAFGMKIYFYDCNISENINEFICCNSPQELFSIADIVSLHLPYNSDTHFIVNKTILNFLKPSSLLINTSRGGIVNEEELIIALESGSIYGYATDVLYGEPNIKNNPIVKFASKNDNVIITPHIGGNTFESIEKTENFICEKLIKIIHSK